MALQIFWALWYAFRSPIAGSGTNEESAPADTSLYQISRRLDPTELDVYVNGIRVSGGRINYVTNVDLKIGIKSMEPRQCRQEAVLREHLRRELPPDVGPADLPTGIPKRDKIGNSAR